MTYKDQVQSENLCGLYGGVTGVSYVHVRTLFYSHQVVQEVGREVRQLG